MLSNTRQPHYLESQNIRDILKLISYDTWLILDLDNTVFEPLLELGSDQWFTQLIIHATQVDLNLKQVVAEVISLYHAIQEYVKSKPVEEKIVLLIQRLQALHIPVLALTLRDKILEKSTLRQLSSIGIDLSGRIIFCNGEDKGKHIKNYFEDQQITPRHVVVVDDKEKHLRSVQSALSPVGTVVTGVRYGFLDQKVAELNMENANGQLMQIKPHLPLSTQQIIERLRIPVPAAPNINYLDYFHFETESSRSDEEETGCELPFNENEQPDLKHCYFKAS